MSGTRDLVESEGWTVLEEDDFGHRPEDAACDPAGFFPEEGLLEVRTGLCGYVTASQPSLAPVREGDTVDLLLFHSALTNEEPATAHAAIALGEEVIWEAFVDIPSATEVYAETVEVGAYPAGTEVVFHLHNHGANTWNLAHVRATTP